MAGEWPEVSLSELTVTPATYGVVQPGQEDPNGVPMVRVNNFRDHTLGLAEVMRIAPEIEAKYERTRIQPGDVLLTIVGSVGQVAIVPEELRGWNIARAVAMIRPKAPELSRWISFVLRSPQAQHQLGVAANTTVQTTINLKDLRELKIPFPEEAERRAIARILGALDDRIELNRRTNKTLEDITSALFKSWFVDFAGVEELEESELGLIPKGWRVATIGEVASVIDCLHAKKPELLSEGKPYLQLNCIRDDGLLGTTEVAHISNTDYVKWTSRIEASPGDCVITNVGRVGAVARIPKGFFAAIGRNMTAIRPNAEFSPTFLIELLVSDFMREEVAHKTDAGTILSALNVKNIPKLRFVMPTTDVLHKFENLARPLRASMEENLAKSQTLVKLRDALLPKLISGELRVKDAERIAGGSA